MVLGRSDLYAVTGRERDIQRIEADPAFAQGLDRLVGRRAGGNLRTAIAEELPEEVANGSPLHLLLDDLAGSTLISGFVFVRWLDHLPEMRERFTKAPPTVACATSARASVPARAPCASDGSIVAQPEHRAPRPAGRSGRPAGLARARRASGARHAARPPHRRVGRGRGARDRCHVPRQRLGPRRGRGRRARVPDAAAEPTGRRESSLSVDAMPRVLPYAECPGAAPNASRMAGHRSAGDAHRGARATAGDGLLHPPQRRAALPGRGARCSPRRCPSSRSQKSSREDGDAGDAERTRRPSSASGRRRTTRRASRCPRPSSSSRARPSSPRSTTPASRSRISTGSPSTPARATRPRWRRFSVCPR